MSQNLIKRQVQERETETVIRTGFSDDYVSDVLRNVLFGKTTLTDRVGEDRVRGGYTGGDDKAFELDEGGVDYRQQE